MKVTIQRNESSRPIEYENVINAFTKGPMYCVLFVRSDGERVSHKFPVDSLFRVCEDYEGSMR